MAKQTQTTVGVDFDPLTLSRLERVSVHKFGKGQGHRQQYIRSIVIPQIALDERIMDSATERTSEEIQSA